MDMPPRSEVICLEHHEPVYQDLMYGFGHPEVPK